MALALGGTRLLLNLSYDLIYQSILAKARNILGYFWQISRQPKIYPKTITTSLYELDLEGKIGLVFHYLQSRKLISQTEIDHQFSSNPVNPTPADNSIETVNYLDHLLVGDVSMINPDEPRGDLALIYLQQSLLRIEYLLVDLKRELEAHQVKWFYRWRKLEVDQYIKHLTLESDILLNRIQIAHQLQQL